MKHRLLRVATAAAVGVTTTFVIIPPAAAAKRPDLKVTSISKPPATLRRGRTFKITDTTKNVGKAKAKASKTRYYLSRDNKRGGKKDFRLAKVRKVKILGKGKAHKGTVKGVVVPKTLAPAGYFLIACADDLKRIRESNEKNNCKASRTKMNVTGAPPAPNITSTDPPSPNNSDQTPLLLGSAEAGSTVKVYAGTCDEANLIVSGPAATFQSPGLQVPDTAALADNTQVDYVATATDNVGNLSACSSARTYEYDVEPPGDVGFTQEPQLTSNDYTADWTWTGESDATYSCTLENGVVGVVDGPVACDVGTYTSPDLRLSQGGPGDGNYTLSVLQTDDAGNPAPSPTESTFLLDVTPPNDVTILDPQPTSPSNDPTPTWDFDATLSPDAHFECRLERNGTVVSDFADCGDPVMSKTYDLSDSGTYPDGTYVFTVQQVDLAGNASLQPAISDDYVLDRVALEPTFDVTPLDPSNDPNPVWDFSGETGATFECTLKDQLDAVVDGPVDCTTGSTYTFDLSNAISYPDGDYTLEVVQTDEATNVSPVGAYTFELDRQAPDPPTIVGSPDDPSNVTTPTWTFNKGTEPSAVTFDCDLRRGVTPVETDVDCSGGSFSPGTPLLDQGVYTFEVTQTDAAGNQSAAATSDFELDTIAPDPPSIDSAPADPSNGTSPTWTFSTTEPGSVTYECDLRRGATPIESGVDCTSGSFTPASPLVDQGTYTLEVTQTDAATNQSAAATSSFELDTIAPDAPNIDSSPADPSNDDTPTWTFSKGAEPSVVTFQCDLSRGLNPVETGVDCSGGSFTPSSPLVDQGVYTLDVYQTDAAGNQSVDPASSSFELDTIAPDPPTIDSYPDNPSNDTTPTWTFSSTEVDPITFQCDLVRGVTPVDTGVDCTGGTYTPTTPLVDQGIYTLEVRQTDDAGNQSNVATWAFELDTIAPDPPTVDSTSPASPADEDQPAVIGTAEAGSDVDVYKTADCTGTPVGSGTAAAYASPGITAVDVPINQSATFRATATDAAGNTSGCSSESILFEHLIPETEPDNNTEAGTPDEVIDFDGDGEPDPITTWTGSSAMGLDTDFFKFVVPAEAAGTGVRAATFDLADGTTCAIDTDVALYAASDLGTPLTTDDDIDDGPNNCSLIDGVDTLVDAGAQNLAAGTYYLKLTTDSVLSIQYRLVIEVGLGDLIEIEDVSTNNDSIPNAQGTITRDRVIRGITDTDADTDDYFRLNLADDSIVRFESFGDTVGECPGGLRTRLTWADGTISWADVENSGANAGQSGSGINDCAALVIYVPSGISYIRLNPFGGIGASAYSIEVDIQSVPVTESEPNDDFASAQVIDADSDTYVNASLSAGEEDWYRFTVPNGSSVRIEVIEAGVPPQVGGGGESCFEMVSRLSLRDAGDQQLTADNNDGRSACSLIDGTSTTPRDDWTGRGTLTEYWLRVDSPSSDPDLRVFDYRLVITVR